VKASDIYVDIRKHWLPLNQTEVVPTKKGITLRPSEYAKLKDVTSVISDFVPQLNSVVPCPYRCETYNSFLSHFLLNLCFFEPTWPFYLKFNLSKTIHFLQRPWFLYVLSKYQAMFKVLQWNARLWKIPTLKIAPSSPKNSLFIGHASNPPYPY
jgi:hypothetical protein